MTLLESMAVALFLLLVVFVVLFGLYVAVRCFTFLISKLDASIHGSGQRTDA